MARIFSLILLAFFIGCKSQTTDPQQIVDRAIEQSGVAKLENATASFSFRNISYQYQKADGDYSFSRTQKDSSGSVTEDVLKNSGLKRFIDDSLIHLNDEKKDAYSASVNSVIYFAFLPQSLNDDAVNKLSLIHI